MTHLHRNVTFKYRGNKIGNFVWNCYYTSCFQNTFTSPSLSAAFIHNGVWCAVFSSFYCENLNSSRCFNLISNVEIVCNIGESTLKLSAKLSLHFNYVLNLILFICGRCSREKLSRLLLERYLRTFDQFHLFQTYLQSRDCMWRRCICFETICETVSDFI